MLIRVTIGATFVVTGGSKIRLPTYAVRGIALTELLRKTATRVSSSGISYSHIRAILSGVGVAEALMGAWLIAGVEEEAAALTGTGFMACALAYVFWARVAIPAKSCGCSRTPEPVGVRSAARAAMFLAAVTVLATWSNIHAAVAFALALSLAGILLFVPSRRWQAIRSFALGILFRRRTRVRLFRSPLWASVADACEGAVHTDERDEWRTGRLLLVSVPTRNGCGVATTLVATIRIQAGTEPPARVVELVEDETHAYVRRVWSGTASLARGSAITTEPAPCQPAPAGAGLWAKRYHGNRRRNDATL